MARKSRTPKATKPVEISDELYAEAYADLDAWNTAHQSVADLVAAEEAEDAEDEVVDTRRSIVPPKYKAAYGKKEHCGDELGYAVSELVRDGKGQIVMEALASLATENGLSLDRWAHLNPGQQSMNLRNVLRGRVKRGEEVVVGGAKFGAPALTAEDLGL